MSQEQKSSWASPKPRERQGIITPLWVRPETFTERGWENSSASVIKNIGQEEAPKGTAGPAADSIYLVIDIITRGSNRETFKFHSRSATEVIYSR